MSQAQLAEQNNTSKKLDFSVTADELKKAFTNALQRKQKSAKVNGFRPNKTPLSVVKKMYGASILIGIAEQIANQRVSAALKESDLNVVNVGQIDNWPVTEEQDWNFGINIDLVPSFELPNFTEVKAKLLRSEIKQEDVAATLEKMRQDHPVYQDIDKPISLGKSVLLDMVYQVVASGEPVPELGEKSFTNSPATEFSGSITKELWHIDKKTLPIEGMEDVLVGLKAGESKALQLEVGDTFANKNWQGKTLYMYLRIHKVQQRSLPEIDAAFAAKFGVKDTDDPVSDLRAGVRGDLEIRLQATLEKANKESLFEALSGATSLQLPQSLVDRNNANIRRNFAMRFISQEQVKSVEKPEDMLPPERFVEAATTQACITEIISKLVKSEDIKVGQQEIQQRIIEAAREYEDPKEYIEKAAKDRDMLSYHATSAVEFKVYELLKERCSIEWQEMSADDVFAGKYQPTNEARAEQENPQQENASTAGGKKKDSK